MGTEVALSALATDRVTVKVGQVVDEVALGVMARLWLSDGGLDLDHQREERERVRKLYGDGRALSDSMAFFPDPVVPTVESRVRRQFRGGCVERLRWHSGYRTWDPDYQDEYDAYQRNQVVHAEHWRHEGGGRTTLVVLHSWMTGHYGLQRHVFQIRRLYRAGLDVVILMLPFHGPRTPVASRFSGQFFPGTSPQRTNEAFGQSVWDVRTLLRRLSQQGAGSLGVMGMSLGGYITSVLATVESSLSFSIPMVPMVSLPDLLWKHGEGRPEREQVEARGITLETARQLYAVHSPLLRQTLVPRHGRMIIAGRGDRICPPTHVSRLWEHWERPRIHWFPGSHITHFGRQALFDEVFDFLSGQPTSTVSREP